STPPNNAARRPGPAPARSGSRILIVFSFKELRADPAQGSSAALEPHIQVCKKIEHIGDRVAIQVSSEARGEPEIEIREEVEYIHRAVVIEIGGARGSGAEDVRRAAGRAGVVVLGRAGNGDAPGDGDGG